MILKKITFECCLTVIFLLGISTLTKGQTKIAVPNTTVQFSDLKVPKKTRIYERRLAKFKTKKIKSLRKILKESALQDKHQIHKYGLLFQGLDSTELEQLHLDLSNIRKTSIDGFSQVDISKPQSFSKDSLENVKSQLPNLYGRDNLVRPNFDSSYLSTPVLYDSIDFDSLNYEQLLKSDLVQDIEGANELTQYQDSFNGYQSSIADNQASPDSLRKYYLSASPDSLIARRLNERLEAFIADQVGANKLKELEGEVIDPQSQVKHYIPSLEKFDYKKPSIPKEQLAKARLLQEKERKKQELLDQISLSNAEEQDKPSVLSRFSIGGYMRYDATKKALELTPVITYAPVKKIQLGVGYQTNISLNGNDSLNTRGVRAFVQYFFLDSYYIHGESEWVMPARVGENSTVKKERNSYLGLGKTFNYKFFRSSLTALYNFNAPTALQPKRFTIRFGLTVSK